MVNYLFLLICALIFSACDSTNSAPSAEQLPVTVDSNIALPYDSISFGNDTDDHNKGNLPTNTVDTLVPNSSNDNE
jgi:hypothetical protein